MMDAVSITARVRVCCGPSLVLLLSRGGDIYVYMHKLEIRSAMLLGREVAIFSALTPHRFTDDPVEICLDIVCRADRERRQLVKVPEPHNRDK